MAQCPSAGRAWQGTVGSRPVASTAFRTCPLCEATCGLEIELEGDELVKVRGDARRRLLARLHLPQGRLARRAARRPRPAAHAADPPRRRARRGDLGRGVRARSTARLPPLLAEQRPQRDRRSTSATRPRTTSRRCSTAACSSRRSARATSSARSHRRPDAEAVVVGLHVRRRAHDPDPRPRPHRPPADPRRQPAGLQRLADDGARHARAPARDPGARRQGRGRRPAPHAHRRARRRAPLHPARDRRAACCSRSSTTLFAEGLADRAGSPSTSTGSTRSRALARAVHAGGRRGADAASRPRRSARMARELAAAERAAVYGRIGTTHAGVRHARELARRRRSTCSPATSTARAARCSRAPPPAQSQRDRASPAAAAASRSAAGRARVRGLPEALGELPVACLAEEIETPARARSARCSRSPATRCSRRRTRAGSRRRSRRSSFCVCVRRLRQRDDAPRRRRPARRRRRSSARTTTSPSTSCRCATWPTTRRPCCRRARPVPHEWETLLRLTGIVTGQGPDADIDAIDDVRRARGVRREVAGAARPARPSSSRASGPERLLDLAAAQRALRRCTLASDLEAAPHGIDLGPLEPRLPGGPAHAERQGRAGAASRSSPTSPRLRGARSRRRQRRHGPDRPPPAALQQLLDAQPRPARQGQGPLHGCTSTPTTRRGSA